MKKTVLSLAFVLSISLAFGNETKPVVNEMMLREVSIVPITALGNKIGKVKVTRLVTVTDCFVTSCGTNCFTHETPLTTEQTLGIMRYYEAICDAQKGKGIGEFGEQDS